MEEAAVLCYNLACIANSPKIYHIRTIHESLKAEYVPDIEIHEWLN
jgi:hypothetical protein